MKKILTYLTAILALISFVPVTANAKGAVVPYVAGWVDKPTAYELDRMTHLMIFQIFPDAQGNLTINHLPSWLTTGISEAKAKGVKVSIAVGGASDQYTPNFITATNSANRSRLVTNIKNLVNQYGLDGIDLDWEFPKNDDQWRQYADLIVDLKNAMPDKRISVAIGGDSPVSQFGNHFITANSGARQYIRDRIFTADAIHIMTYDMMGVTQPVRWNTHSDAEASIVCLQKWDEWGTGAPNYSREKLFIGAAFYATQGTNGDDTQSLQRKINWTYDFGGGGVIIWELSHGRSGNTNDMLNTLWAANTAKGGYQPNGSSTVVNHNITVTHNGWGSITSNGSTVNSGETVSVQNGQNRSFTFAPNNGYQVTYMTVNGSFVAAGNSHTITNITSAQTVDVTFSKRFAIPAEFNATEYSRKSNEIVIENSELTKEERSLGYLANNSKFEYLISVADAGKYLVSVETARGQSGNQELRLHSGTNTTVLGTIPVPGGNNWFAFTLRNVVIDLAAGDQTLRFVANGAINIRNITITKECDDNTWSEWTDWTTVEAATCTEAGSKERARSCIYDPKRIETDNEIIPQFTEEECNATTGIAEIENTSIIVYPNPVKDILIIKNEQLIINDLKICDLSGRTVGAGLVPAQSGRPQGLPLQINVSNLPKGIYFVKIETEKGVVVGKFLKE